MTSIAGIDGDGGRDSRLGIPKEMGVHGASMIDGLHTPLIILQLHMPVVQKANHLRGYLKPNRPGVEHPVPNAKLHNK